MKKWETISKSKIGITEVGVDELINILLENRGIKTKIDKQKFLNPKLSDINPLALGISLDQLKKAIKRIEKAIKSKEKIIIFGDYDVDGICASAILWETLNKLSANVLPFIPNRFEEGYGLSIAGIQNLISKYSDLGLIITVDNGIVANEPVNYANQQGIDVIITDHHIPAGYSPKSYALVHTTKLCGAGVAYLLSQELRTKIKNLRPKTKDPEDDHLSLVALATVADLVPLTYENRTLLYFGLEKLRQTKRVGLLALITKAGIKKEDIDTYQIGHMIAPRLNAMGRLASAMDSLRLICTKDKVKAEKFSDLLNNTNLERQQITKDALAHAKGKIEDNALENLIFIADESFAQGIIGLVAGRLVEEYYLPSIVISKGRKLSKASVRSVKGFNIIEFLRSAQDLLVDVGGHPMAAGFTVETAKIEELKEKLFKNIKNLINKDHLQRILRIDLEFPVQSINNSIFSGIQKLAPFGMGNPEPTFLTKNLQIESIRVVGKDGKHAKVNLKSQISNLKFDGIIFNVDSNKLSIGDRVDVVYTMQENSWHGRSKIELKIKDLAKS